MLRTRLITAAALLAVLLPLLAWGGARLFGACMALFTSVAMWEWARLAGLRGAAPVAWALLWLATAVSVLLGLPPAFDSHLGFALSTVAWAGLLAGALPRAALPRWLGHPPLLGALGFLLLFAAWLALWHARAQGVGFLLSVLMLVWIADIAAYFGGRALGGWRLAPRISPGKTVSGAVCGVLAVVGYVALCARVPELQDSLGARLAQRWGLGPALLAGALLAAWSVAGDLFESLLKRRVGVKDSSGLLPGHGGVLDRIDALLPLLPLVMLLVP